MKDNEQLQYENEQLAQGNNKLWTQLEKSAEILSHHEAYISLLEEENAKLKELLKECKTPIKVYNELFGNKEELLTKIDEVLK